MSLIIVYILTIRLCYMHKNLTEMSNDCTCDVDTNYACNFVFVNLFYFFFYNSLKTKLRAAYLESCQASNIDRFAKIVND